VGSRQGNRGIRGPRGGGVGEGEGRGGEGNGSGG